MSDPSSPFDPRAEELFRLYLTDLNAGRKPDLESLCRKHPDLAHDLREMRTTIELAMRLWPQAPSHGPLAERLKQKYGDEVDPGVSLGDEPKSDAGTSSKLFEKLSAVGARGTRYKLLGEVARGGMGAVLKIWDDELRRTLAMKVVLGRGEEKTGETLDVDPKTLGRFLEEAQVTGQLDHPGIVPVHELGLDAAGRVYFTMRLVKGEELKLIFEHVRTGHDGWNQVRALNVMLRVCEAVSFAHSKKVIHRDLKPANVMVGKFGEVYVMDWGLARVLGREDKHDLRLEQRSVSGPSMVKTERHDDRGDTPDSPLVTMDGDVVGTPSFMSPEQAKGQLDRLGPHSDVYSAGAMLYQLVGGEMPYVPADARISQHRILSRLLDGPPKPLLSLAPRAPRELIAIVEKAMARDIAQRYADIQVLADDLRAYLEGRVVAAYESGVWAETKKWVERNRLLAATLAAFVLAILGGATAMTLKSGAEASARLASEREQVATQKSADLLAVATLQDLDDLVAEADALWPVDPDMMPRYERWLEKARILIEGHPEDRVQRIKGTVSLSQHRAKLLEIQARALPQSEADQQHEREARPEFAEWTAKKDGLTWYSRMLGLEPWPSEAEVEAELAKESLPSDAGELNDMAWALVDPDNPVSGQEVKGLLLARRAAEAGTAALKTEKRETPWGRLARAVEAATPASKAGKRDPLAWALYRVGRFEAAVTEEKRAVEALGAGNRSEYAGYLAKLEKAIGRWQGETALPERHAKRDTLAHEVEVLEREVNRRQKWEFGDREDRWWNTQLSKLVADLEALQDSKIGLHSSGISPQHGWGVRKRYELASSLVVQTIEGVEAKRRWSEAIEAIAKSDKYRGVKWPSGDRLVPQLGLLPIGADPASGLWEFAHLATGVQAQRGADGRLVLDEKMGVVLVLIPGGTFRLRAQTDPAQANFDPGASDDERPVLECTLSPYFLSKYELTQGQWQRLTDKSPSVYRAGTSTGGKAATLLNPVEHVSWTDCTEFMRRVGLRLPTEAQWELAARAGTSTNWWTGANIKQLDGAANVADTTLKANVPGFTCN